MEKIPRHYKTESNGKMIDVNTGVEIDRATLLPVKQQPSTAEHLSLFSEENKKWAADVTAEAKKKYKADIYFQGEDHNFRTPEKHVEYITETGKKNDWLEYEKEKKAERGCKLDD